MTVANRDLLDDMLIVAAQLEVLAARLDCNIAPELCERALKLRRCIHLAIHQEIHP
jgi:hypothetical protein